MEHNPTQDVSIETYAGSREEIRIVKLRGALTIHNFFDFQDLTRKQSEARVLIIDLGDVPYIDSAALGSLIGVHVSRERGGRKYALVNVNERLKRLFDISGVNQFLVVFDTMADAEAAVGV